MKTFKPKIPGFLIGIKIVIVNINNGTLEKIFKADNSTILRPIVDNKKM